MPAALLTRSSPVTSTVVAAAPKAMLTGTVTGVLERTSTSWTNIPKPVMFTVMWYEL